LLSIEQFFQMSRAPTNKNVRLPDVLEPDPEAGSRTLRRGLQVLDAVAASGHGGARVVDLCHAVGLERATVYRLLATLREAGYVVTQGRFRYVPGPRLRQPVPHMPNLAIRLQPVLEHISSVSGDAAFAIVRDGALSLCIARQLGSHPVQILVVQPGTHQPLGDEQVDAIVAANATELARYGGMTPERIRLLIRATRERGWSIIGNHATRNVLAVGMAVRNARDEPVAAISVATTLARMPRERQQWIAREIRQGIKALLPDGL
jgi:DNA-binding IclR family transcriptional regulator